MLEYAVMSKCLVFGYYVELLTRSRMMISKRFDAYYKALIGHGN